MLLLTGDVSLFRSNPLFPDRFSPLLQVDHIALSEACRDVVTAELTRFLSPKGPMVLIISYETFRIHCNRFYVRHHGQAIL